MKHIKIFLIIFFCSLWINGFANNYYFSAISGNDSYTSTQAQNPLTPWQSTAKLNSFFSNINPGDSILFKKGEVFRGVIVANKSGTISQPIVIGAFGTGAMPILTLPAVTGWTLNTTDNVYSATKQMWPGISIFYQDGIPLIPMASSAACTDGSWFCTNTTIYYKPATGTIANHTITVGNILAITGYAPGLDLSDCSYITVDGLEFDAFATGIQTFDIAAGTVGLTIQNSTFNYCQHGLMIMPDTGNNTNMTVQNCLFYRNQCAINMYTTSSPGNRPNQTWGTNIGCKILNNEMSQNGTIDGTTHWIYGTDYEGIGLQNFMNGTISNNYIHDGFQIGIIFYNLNTRSSDNNTISNNRIFNNNKGGLDFMGDNMDQGSTGDYSFNNNFISNNLFVNSAYTGVFDGTIVIYQGVNTTGMNYFVNNTLSGSSNIVTFPTSRAPFFTIENNIYYNPGTYDFVSWLWPTKPASLTMDYNLYYSSPAITNGFVIKTGMSLATIQLQGVEMHSLLVNPLLVNPVIVGPTDSDYYLQSTSPAINVGINVGLPFSGTAPDLGAFEYPSCSIAQPVIQSSQ
jgi:hypothetical protein